ncbi:TnsA endonuclease N-terminal domain-containing protein [Pseudomonas sp. 210_17 TE3656]|jgi:hypothetical protein
MIRDIDSPTFARDVARRVHRGRRALVLKSLKGKGGELRVESGLERDVGLMLDIDPRVSELAAQPFTLELQSNSVLPSRQDYLKRPGVKPRFYTPDFLCRLDDGSVLAIEAKHSRFSAAFEAKREAIEKCLNSYGIGFMLVLDTAVSPTVMQALSSLHLLRAGYLEPLRSTAETEISALLNSATCWSVEELALRLTSGRVGVLAGLLAGLLSADFSKSLFSPTSEVHAAYGDLSHFQFLQVRP